MRTRQSLSIWTNSHSAASATVMPSSATSHHCDHHGSCSDSPHCQLPVHPGRSVYNKHCNRSPSLSTPDDSDDDLNEDDIPSFTHPSLSQPAVGKPLDKGKAPARYEPEQLAPPSAGTRAQGSLSLSGNIGSSSSGAQRGSRQNVGGVQVETRCVMNAACL